VAYGKIGLDPVGFDHITVVELLNAWEGKAEEDTHKEKEMWRAASWVASFANQFTGKDGKYKTAKELLPDVWVEKKEVKVDKKILESRHQKFKKILKVK
jgi:hypothetical protein